MKNRSFDAQRRTLIKAVAAGTAASGMLTPAVAAGADPWAAAQAIADKLANPVTFRAEDFAVTLFGARPCATATVTGAVSHHDNGELLTAAPDAFDCHPAFAAAIAACHKAGGGRVLIPAGTWYCAGPIELLSNVHVHLQAGCRVIFSSDPADYAKAGQVDCGPNGRLVQSRWQSNDCLNFSAMVYAFGQRNIALTGEDWTSVLDGQGGVRNPRTGHSWWDWKGRNRAFQADNQGMSGAEAMRPSENTPNARNTDAPLRAMGLDDAQRAHILGAGEQWRADVQFLPALSEAGVPVGKRVFGLGHQLRPPMVQLIGCTDVLLQGYQVTHSPFWQHHPVNCRNLTIRGVYANSMGPNSDGFDPEACDHVLVERCTFNTGDDCIAIKAGKNRDVQFGPSQHIVIQHCTMQSGHGAVTLGSEMAGGIQYVYAQDLVFENRYWQTSPLDIAIRLKTNLNRGGFLRHFYVRNVRIPNGVRTTPNFYGSLAGSPIKSRTVATAGGGIVTFDCDYAPAADNVRIRPPEVSDIHISDVRVGNVVKSGQAVSCYQALVVLGPVASDYNGPAPAPPVLPVRNVTIRDCDFGNPANATAPWFLYNVAGLTLENVRVGGRTIAAETLSAGVAPPV
jgi:polygalacturonase